MSRIGQEIEPTEAVSSALRIIKAHSRRQAMDWSLVLASQNIETVIQKPDGESVWELHVPTHDYDAGLDAILRYRIENRSWPWQHPAGQTGHGFDWAALAWCLLVGFFFELQARASLLAIGMMDNTAVSQGQWWRFFTATWLHADLGHLAANLTLGLVLLGLVMGRFRTGLGLLAAYLAGVGGNICAWLVSGPGHQSLGASGVVMGCLGLLTVPSLGLLRGQLRPLKYLLSGLGGGVMLFVLFGLAPGTDTLAHLGGFVVGLGLGALLSLAPALGTRAAVNVAAGAAFAALVIWPWAAALLTQARL